MGTTHSPPTMPQKPRAPAGRGGRVLWAVQGLLVGSLALLAGVTLKREAAIHSLNREVGELRGLLVSLAEKEGTLEHELERGRRDLSAGELPEMYDVSYFEARGRHRPLGLYGGGEVLGDRGPAGPSHHQGQRNHPGERYPGSTQAPPERSPATQAAFSTWSRATRSASRTQVLQARSTRALDAPSWASSSSRGTGYEINKNSNCVDK